MGKNLAFYCFDEINTSICLRKFFEEEFVAGKLLWTNVYWSQSYLLIELAVLLKLIKIFLFKIGDFLNNKDRLWKKMLTVFFMEFYQNYVGPLEDPRSPFLQHPDSFEHLEVAKK
jgi:hypothetical protein